MASDWGKIIIPGDRQSDADAVRNLMVGRLRDGRFGDESVDRVLQDDELVGRLTTYLGNYLRAVIEASGPIEQVQLVVRGIIGKAGYNTECVELRAQRDERKSSVPGALGALPLQNVQLPYELGPMALQLVGGLQRDQTQEREQAGIILKGTEALAVMREDPSITVGRVGQGLVYVNRLLENSMAVPLPGEHGPRIAEGANVLVVPAHGFPLESRESMLLTWPYPTDEAPEEVQPNIVARHSLKAA